MTATRHLNLAEMARLFETPYSRLYNAVKSHELHPDGWSGGMFLFSPKAVLAARKRLAELERNSMVRTKPDPDQKIARRRDPDAVVAVGRPALGEQNFS